MGRWRLQYLWPIAFLAGSCTPSAGDPSYLDRVRGSGYDSIFAIRILSAAMVADEFGNDCYYKYESEITMPVRGKALPGHFQFSFRSGLQVGEKYLIYFSAEDAKLHRIGQEPLSPCQKNLSGYLLVYNEVHKIGQVWNGKKWVDVVQLDNGLERVPAEHEMDQTLRFADLEYVIGELKK
jgi:hypothetical protein